MENPVELTGGMVWIWLSVLFLHMELSGEIQFAEEFG